MRVISLLTLIFALVLTRAQADSASKAQKIDAIFKITKVEETQKRIFDQIQNMMAAQAPPPGASAESKAASQELSKKIMDLVAQKMSWERMRPIWVRLYDETFTEDELDGMLAFYQSAAGEAMLQKMPVLLTKTMSVAQQQMTELTPEIQKMTKEYMDQHKGDVPKQ